MSSCQSAIVPNLVSSRSKFNTTKKSKKYQFIVKSSEVISNSLHKISHFIARIMHSYKPPLL